MKWWKKCWYVLQFKPGEPHEAEAQMLRQAEVSDQTIKCQKMFQENSTFPRQVGKPNPWYGREAAGRVCGHGSSDYGNKMIWVHKVKTELSGKKWAALI